MLQWLSALILIQLSEKHHSPKFFELIDLLPES